MGVRYGLTENETTSVVSWMIYTAIPTSVGTSTKILSRSPGTGNIGWAELQLAISSGYSVQVIDDATDVVSWITAF